VAPGTAEEEPAKCDFGILFHAKEYPKEYRMTKYGPLYPIGADEMGGEKDPRIGSKSSVHDEDFPLRNLIYLLSRNQVYELDVRKADFPEDALSDKEFCTVNAGSLGSLDVVFDVNYFPWITPTSGGDACPVLLSPQDGFPPCLRLRQAIFDIPDTETAISSVVDRLDVSDVKSLRSLVDGDGHNALCSMLPRENNEAIVKVPFTDIEMHVTNHGLTYFCMIGIRSTRTSSAGETGCSQHQRGRQAVCGDPWAR